MDATAATLTPTTIPESQAHEASRRIRCNLSRRNGRIGRSEGRDDQARSCTWQGGGFVSRVGFDARGQQRGDDYTAHRYHQPSDEYSPDFDLRGAAQIATIVQRFGATLANSPVKPTWNKDAEFKAVSDDGK